jgi:hypothetical protein
MDVQDVRRIREGFEDMTAAIDQAAPDMTHAHEPRSHRIGKDDR